MTTLSTVFLTPFYLYTLLRTLLATGLMSDAYSAGAMFQMQRTVESTMAASGVQCADGGMPYMVSLSDVSDVSDSSSASSWSAYDSFTKSSATTSAILPFASLPPPALPILPISPSPTYEWFAIQLRWMCAVLCYFAVVVSMISRRLSGVLAETSGVSVAKTFEQNQKCLRCLETIVTCVSLLVYVGDKAYELYLQYAVSTPYRNGDSDVGQMFVGEVVLVVFIGLGALGSVLLQYTRCTGVKTEDAVKNQLSGEYVSTSML